MKYSGTYSCKEIKDVINNTKKSIIKRVEDTSTATAKSTPTDMSKEDKESWGNIGKSLYDYGKTWLGSSGTATNPTTDSKTSTAQTTKSTTSGGGYSQVGKGYVLSNTFTPQVVTTLRQSIGSLDTSSTLSQNDINLLYQKISAL
jgi:hypothetical protein